MEHAQERALWERTTAEWLAIAFPALAKHAREVAQGDLGVLWVTIDTADMRKMLAGGQLHLIPSWQPLAEFIGAVKMSGDIGPEAAQRWADMVAVMDPRRDVALFLTSTPAADEHWYSRFIVVHDGKVPVH